MAGRMDFGFEDTDHTDLGVDFEGFLGRDEARGGIDDDFEVLTRRTLDGEDVQPGLGAGEAHGAFADDAQAVLVAVLDGGAVGRERLRQWRRPRGEDAELAGGQDGAEIVRLRDANEVESLAEGWTWGGWKKPHADGFLIPLEDAESLTDMGHGAFDADEVESIVAETETEDIA